MGRQHRPLVHLDHGDRPLGATRRVQIGRNAMVETITEFDALRALAYDVDGLPKRVAGSPTLELAAVRTRHGRHETARSKSVRAHCRSSPSEWCAGFKRDSPTSCSPAWRDDSRSLVTRQPDIIVIMTDEERAIPPYESPS